MLKLDPVNICPHWPQQKAPSAADVREGPRHSEG